MLLCLSNIGDIMATSFRFLYWRVCCYVCEKPKKMKRTKSVRGSVRLDSRFSRTRNNSFRRSVRNSTRSADSGFAAYSDIAPSHSDTEIRYHEETTRRSASVPRQRSNRHNRAVDVPSPRKISHNSTLPRPNYINKEQGHTEIEMDPILLANTSILCNKYVVGKNDGFVVPIPGKGLIQREKKGRSRATSMPPSRQDRSMPKSQNFLEPPKFSSPEPSDSEEVRSTRGRPRGRSPTRRSRSPNPQVNTSPRMMTPLGYGHKSKYLDDPDSDDEYFDDEYYDISGRTRIKPVPIWLCVLLVISYILAGAYLFKTWENWPYLDAAYFCFITLTTIGFGDLVPAKGVSQDGYYATISIALCSLYLLFGISLLAMSFNLVQEEVISNVRSVAKTLGIIKPDSDEEDEEL